MPGGDLKDMACARAAHYSPGEGSSISRDSAARNRESRGTAGGMFHEVDPQLQPCIDLSGIYSLLDLWAQRYI